MHWARWAAGFWTLHNHWLNNGHTNTATTVCWMRPGDDGVYDHRPSRAASMTHLGVVSVAKCRFRFVVPRTVGSVVAVVVARQVRETSIDCSDTSGTCVSAINSLSSAASGVKRIPFPVIRKLVCIAPRFVVLVKIDATQLEIASKVVMVS